MEKFIYTNKMGQSLTIEYGGNYILESYDGLANTEIIPISTKGYTQHGNTLNRTMLGIRIISIYFYLHEDSMANFYEKRRYLSQVFNPLLGEGKLYYINDYTSKMINVLPTVLPSQVEKLGSLQLFNIELTANDPFWYDTALNTKRMGDYENGLKFPLFSASHKFATMGSIATITNEGDWETPLAIEFMGTAVNPVINLLNTNQKMKVNKTLLLNEKLIINTAYGNKTVIFENASGTQTSAYNLISNDSLFFQLQVGENRLTFGSEGGQPEVFLSWRDRFIGV